jgi:hypothetical protein
MFVLVDNILQIVWIHLLHGVLQNQDSEYVVQAKIKSIKKIWLILQV